MLCVGVVIQSLIYLHCKIVDWESWLTAPGRKLSSFTTIFYAKIISSQLTCPEGICVNRLAVPCGWDSASHSIPHPCLTLLPTLPKPQPSAGSHQNSNIPVLPPIPIPSELIPEENSLHVLPPLNTCSKLHLVGSLYDIDLWCTEIQT